MGEIHNHSTSNKEYESSVSSKYNRRHTPIALDILDAIEMAVERAISKYEKREEEIWEEKSKIIMNAFPDGIQNHRNTHQAMIDAAKAQENFWKELKLDLTKKGIWGILTVLVGLALVGLAAKAGVRWS